MAPGPAVSSPAAQDFTDAEDATSADYPGEGGAGDDLTLGVLVRAAPGCPVHTIGVGMSLAALDPQPPAPLLLIGRASNLPGNPLVAPGPDTASNSHIRTLSKLAFSASRNSNARRGSAISSPWRRRPLLCSGTPGPTAAAHPRRAGVPTRPLVGVHRFRRRAHPSPLGCGPTAELLLPDPNLARDLLNRAPGINRQTSRVATVCPDASPAPGTRDSICLSRHHLAGHDSDHSGSTPYIANRLIRFADAARVSVLDYPYNPKFHLTAGPPPPQMRLKNTEQARPIKRWEEPECR